MHANQQTGFLDHLGLTADELQRARDEDAQLDDACRDLEEVVNILKTGSPNSDLAELARELEAEIRQRLRAGSK